MPEETVIIKGEVEGYSRQPKKFQGGRGSIGMKIDGEWHNILGKLTDIAQIQRDFPKGTIVQLAEKQNERGYVDVIEGSVKKIEKEQAYPEGKKPISDDRKDRDFVSCFMAAVDIQIKVIEDKLIRSEKLERAKCSKEILEQAQQLYLDFQKGKEDLKQEGKW
ncbi:hypothetical protein LCGC14_1700940 [marine sediment metagenome]|uniref:Uncharacterized protein n=1 Tax=marine sediment metagenome TaxID=412755 RepID=A0A0F9JYF4_9ZZZZ